MSTLKIFLIFDTTEAFLTKYPDSKKRKSFVKYIYALQNEIRTRQVLKILLKDPDPEVRKELAKYIDSLQSTETSIEVLHILRQDPDPDVRATTVQNINKFNTQIKKEILNIFTRDPDPSVRKRVLKEAVSAGNPERDNILDILMEDPDPFVREHIPFVLTITANIQSIIGIIGALHQPNLTQQKKIINRLKVLMKDPAPDVRKSTAEYVTFLKDTKTSKKILNTLITDPDPDVRRGVVKGVVKLGGTIGESLLNRLMADSDPTVRMDIPFELRRYYSKIQKESIVEKFKILTTDAVPSVRTATAENASDLNNYRASMEILNTLIQDPSPEVRKGVITGAVKLNGRKRNHLLDMLMQEKNSQIKKSIINEIFKKYSVVTESKRTAILKFFAKDKDPLMRVEVASAVTHLMSIKKSEQILNTLIYDPSIKVIQQVMKSAIDLGLPIAQRIIKKILTKHPSPDFRKTILKSITDQSEQTKILKSNSYKSKQALVSIDFKNIETNFTTNLNKIINDKNLKTPIHLTNFYSKRKMKTTLIEKYPDPEDRKKLIQLAIEKGGPLGEKNLNILITDPDPNVRKEIPYQLSFSPQSKISKTKSLHIFKILMIDPIPKVRKEVAQYIADLKDRKQAIQILKTLIKDSAPDVRRGVVIGAIKVGGLQGNDMLNTLIVDSNPIVRQSITKVATHYNSSIHPNNAAKMFEHLMTDPVPEVREEVAKDAHHLHAPIKSIFNHLIKDPIPSVRASAVKGALSLGGSIGENILSIGIKDSNPHVRQKIAMYITHSQIRTEVVFNTLKILSTDWSTDVRRLTADSVSHWEEKAKAEEILMLLAEDTNLSVIQQVMKSAVIIGQDVAERILSKIFYNHSNPNTRKESYQYSRIHQIDIRTSRKTTEENAENRQLRSDKSCESSMLGEF